MQYLLGQIIELTLMNDTNRVGIISSYTTNGVPRAKFIDDDGDIEEKMTVESERKPLREKCSTKISPSGHKIYYGSLVKKNVKLSETVKLRASEADIRKSLEAANAVYKAMSKMKNSRSPS